MLIPTDELLFGVAPAILIDCAKQLNDWSEPFSEDDFCAAIGAPPREARPVLVQLEQAGFVASSEQPDRFRGTPKLSQLALAHVGKGLTRIAAEQLLAKVLSTVREVNADPLAFPYGVTCVAVFGSYLTEKQVLGDLDIGIALSKDRNPYPRSASWREALKFDTAQRNKTYAALRLRKPKLISIHDMQEVAQLGTPFRIVFGVWSEK